MNFLIALAGGSAVGALVSGIFTLIFRHLDKKDHPIKEQFEKIDRRLDKAEKDSVRTQMLLMIHDYPEATTEILELAQHYFSDLKGDWYMTNMFNTWLEQQHVGRPDWFNNKK